jgi:hypothetical protein
MKNQERTKTQKIISLTFAREIIGVVANPNRNNRSRKGRSRVQVGIQKTEGLRSCLKAVWLRSCSNISLLGFLEQVARQRLLPHLPQDHSKIRTQGVSPCLRLGSHWRCGHISLGRVLPPCFLSLGVWCCSYLIIKTHTTDKINNF